jgi:solute carrier family 26 (sodium-independent sulfate anion transporter), member 11
LQDRPWNLPGPRNAVLSSDDESKPTLKAIILDFSSVNNVDVTSVQNLIDVRNQLDRYATPNAVQWHFASINSRWTKRALASAGFGFPAELAGEEAPPHHWKPVFSVAEIGGDDSAAHAAELEELRKSGALAQDVELVKGEEATAAQKRARYVLVHGVNLPLFHVDLTSAVNSAQRYAEKL